MAKSRIANEMERTGLFFQQCSGMAALKSAMEKGGGAVRSKSPSYGKQRQKQTLSSRSFLVRAQPYLPTGLRLKLDHLAPSVAILELATIPLPLCTDS